MHLLTVYKRYDSSLIGLNMNFNNICFEDNKIVSVNTDLLGKKKIIFKFETMWTQELGT